MSEPRPIPIRLSLMRNLIAGVLVLGVAIVLITVIGSRRAVRAVSERMVDQTVHQLNGELEGFVAPVYTGINVVRGWYDDGLIDLDDPDAIDLRVRDLVREIGAVSSVLIATESGREVMLMRTADGWQSRRTDRARWGRASQFVRWHDDDFDDRQASMDDVDYDPRTRPWFTGALETADAGAPGDVYWTEPYTFFTSGAPGMTAATVLGGPDGERIVVGLDVLLSDVTQFTQSISVAARGRAMVLTDDTRVIGLPRDARFDDPAQRHAALLTTPAEFGTPDIVAGAEAVMARPPEARFEPVRFRADGEAWWGSAQSFALTGERELIIAVTIPESDLLGGIVHIRLAIVVLVVVLLTIGIFRVVRLAGRFSQPIERLVVESDRISQGDFEPGLPIVTNVDEVRQLAQAHDRMREGLRTLVKLERDLRIARDIQQGTFPQQMPRAEGFDVYGWNEPADTTGGDTYDVIGYAVAEEADHRERIRAEIVTDDVAAPRVLLVLADATGHGIGPALSSTQFRSMVRMAVRAGLGLRETVRFLNEQLCQDLPSSRFITAWFGRLDPARARIDTFSAGQAPLVHVHAATGSCTVSAADAPPLGIVPEMEIESTNEIELAPGDLFAVISDGIFESANADGELFGTERVCAVLTEHADEPLDALVRRLCDEVESFTGRAPAADDRTVVLVRRHAAS